MADEATRVRAVLLDAMGTLLRLVPPTAALAERLGVSEATAAHAFRAEVAFYLEHQSEGRDAAGLADLRRRSADVLADAAGVPRAGALDALMASLRFEAFADAAAPLAELRARGLRLVVVSNWDCSLGDVLDRVGLRAAVDEVVASAVVGAAKPDPRIFAAALERAGCSAPEAVHVGDSLELDVAGAHAAGVRPILLDRARTGGPAGFARIRTLAQLPALLS